MDYFNRNELWNYRTPLPTPSIPSLSYCELKYRNVRLLIYNLNF